MSTKTRPWLSGHCGQGNPEHVHKQCRLEYEGVPCSCFCHMEPEPYVDPAPVFDADNPTGLHHGLDELVYHRHPTSLSVTGAKTLLKAPALFKYRQTHPMESTVFDFGHAAHAEVLGIGAEIVIIQRTWVDKAGDVTDVQEATDLKSLSAQAHVEEIRAAGKIPLLRKDYIRVQEMAAVLADVPLVQQLMSDGQAEVSAFRVDDATGVMRRSRFDWVNDLLVDYKTTVDAEPSAFARSAAKYGYFQQAAWYTDIAEDLGLKPRGFLFIAQEKTAPYLASVTELVGDAIDRGRELNQRALEIFRDCTETDRWPGYGDQVVPIDIPRYAYYDQETPA